MRRKKYSEPLETKRNHSIVSDNILGFYSVITKFTRKS